MSNSCKEPQVYKHAISDARCVFDMAVSELHLLFILIHMVKLLRYWQDTMFFVLNTKYDKCGMLRYVKFYGIPLRYVKFMLNDIYPITQ